MQEFFSLKTMRFFQEKPILNDYRDKFIMVISKCLRVDVGINLINKTQK
jgi:hypothetical protein